jgi:hypothetical protein
MKGLVCNCKGQLSADLVHTMMQVLQEGWTHALHMEALRWGDGKGYIPYICQKVKPTRL